MWRAASAWRPRGSDRSSAPSAGRRHQRKRSVALGVTTAGGSFGQFAIVPFVSLLQYRVDNWHTTMFILGVMSMVMVPLAFGLREQRAAPPRPGAAIPQGSGDALQEAFQTQGF